MDDESSTATTSKVAFGPLDPVFAFGDTSQIEPEIGVFSSQIARDRECRAAMVQCSTRQFQVDGCAGWNAVDYHMEQLSWEVQDVESLVLVRWQVQDVEILMTLTVAWIGIRFRFQVRKFV